MNEDTETLAELMLHADQFCSKVEAATQDVAPNPEEKELRTKIGQCRNQLAYLQEVFNDGKLNIENPRVRADFRQLVMALALDFFLCPQRDRFQNFPHACID